MREMNKLEDIGPKLYDDIIYLERPKSKYPKLSMEQRAAQFAPFSALNGFSDKINESGRYTDTKRILTDEEKLIINDKLNIIDNNKLCLVKIKYFVKDNKKNGGKYIEIIGRVRKLDKYKCEVVLDDKTIVPIDDIINIKVIN